MTGDAPADSNTWLWWCIACSRVEANRLVVGADGVVLSDPAAGGCGHVLVMYPLPGTADALLLGCTCPATRCRLPGHLRRLDRPPAV